MSQIRSLSEKFEVHGVDIPHYSLKEQIFLPFLLRKLRVDLVHYLHFNSPVFSRIPSIVTIHDLILSFYPGKSLGGYIKEKAYRLVLSSITARAEKIVSVSHHTKKDLIELLSLDESRIEVIHNGVDTDFQRGPLPEDTTRLSQFYGLTEGYILAIGVHRVHKNFGRLVEAFALLQKNGYTGKLVIAGKEDPRNHEVRDMIRLHRISQSVVLTGYIDNADLRTLLAKASVFVMPSLYEGFGIPILEAMASGVPVACSQTTSLPEVGGDAARYFHPLRVEDISECISTILSDQEVQTQMIQA